MASFRTRSVSFLQSANERESTHMEEFVLGCWSATDKTHRAFQSRAQLVPTKKHDLDAAPYPWNPAFAGM